MTFQYRKLHLLWILIVILFNGVSVTLAQQSGLCSGFSSTLKVGQQGHVTPGQANNLRQNPGTSQTKVGQIPGNEIFMVIGGPVCADNYSWWQVNYKGIVGWTAEGTGNQHWLDTNVSASTVPRTPVNGLVGTIAQTLNEETGCGGRGPFGRLGVNGGDPQKLGNGDLVSYSIGDDPSFKRDPDVCIDAADAGTAYAVSPAGEVIAPFIDSDLNQNMRKVRLPLWAYSQPGTWEIGISGFRIYVDVLRASRPVFVQSDQGDTLIGGFQPNEQVVIVTAPGERKISGITYGDVSGTLVLMDGNGFYVGAMPSGENWVAAIGSSGWLAVAPHIDSLEANGDQEYARNLLFDAFFGSTFVPSPVPRADAATPVPGS